MSSIATQLYYTYNLNHGVKLTVLPMAFLTGNKEGHTFYISVVNNKGSVDLSDASVSGWFIPNDKGLVDDLSVPLSGRIESNTAILSLPQEAYLETGRFSLVINLNKNGKTSTIFWGSGNVSRSNTDSQVDVGDVIPSLEDLLAQISRIEKAITDANAAKDAANTAAKYANDEAKKIDGLTVDAKSTDMPSAEVSVKNGVRHISFGLVTPRIAFEVETGAAGTDVKIEQSGTPENPVVKLTIPRGDTGNVNGLDYYEGEPAALGEASPGTVNGVARGNHVHPMPSANDVGARPNTWMPNANDVGALPKDGTAKNAQRLEGKSAKYYDAQDNLLDNGHFANPVNQRRQVVYSGAEQYTIDRWRSTSTLSVTVGEEKITLACAQDALTMGGFRQYIAPERKIQDGDVLTLACMSADGVTHIGTATASVTSTVDAFGDHESTFTGQINAQEGYAQFLVPIGGSIDLVWALLIKGEYSAEDIAFKPRRYIDEYLECARYYQYVYMRRPVGSFNSTSVMLINVPLIVPMRRNDPAVNTLITPTGIRLAGDSHEITRYTMSMSNYNPKEGNCALVSMEFSPTLAKMADSYNAAYLVNTLSLGLSCDLPDPSLEEGDEE